MPKGKHAAALFEVMGRGSAGEPGASPTATPKWWAKRPASESAAPETPLMQIDRDHHQVTFSMSTASAITIAFGVLVLIGIAFIFGEHVGRRQGPMTAITTEDLMRSAANPQVMQVQPGVNGPTHSTEEPTPPAGAEGANDNQETQQTQANHGYATAPQSVDRQAGLNYVIMQSYPPDMHASAVEAQTVLLLHGIPCTIEPVPSRLRRSAKGWVSVIGTTGFKSTVEPEFKTYVQSIDAANGDLHGKFKRLQPIPYKWP